MVKTIIFDLGNVIVPFDFKRAYARMEALSPYAAAEILTRLRATDLVNRFETGRIGAEGFVSELSRMLELKTTHREFYDVFNCIFLPEPLLPESLLIALRERYRLLLLSNTNPIHFEMIERTYPLLRHFHHSVLSYQVGAAKPSPQIYEEALLRAECGPDECVFFDDIAAYVEAARGAGIDAVQFQSAGQVEEELRRRGVTW
ncbi:MAG: HAD family phosphatase [Acidobacteriota bacterium]|nr:HAD family phosphatase [Acidobacteriota bacterium]